MNESVDPVDAVFQHLVRVGDGRHGFGWREKVNRGLNRSTGYISNDISRRTMRVGTLVRVLEILGEDPREFFEEALRPTIRYHRVPRLLSKDPKETVPSLASAVDGLTIEEGASDKDFASDLLMTIAEKKLSEPAQALKMVLHALPLVAAGGLEQSLALPLLLEWSSIQVKLNRHQEARAGYSFVASESERLGCTRTKAEVLLKSATLVFRETSSPLAALEEANQAYLSFLDQGNRVGMGRSLVTRSWFLHFLGQNSTAVNNLQLALELLPRNDKYACPAHQATGIVLNSLGEHSEAFAHLEAAENFCKVPYQFGKVAWFRAKVAAQNGDSQTATDHFLAAKEHLSLHSPVDLILVTLDFGQHCLWTGEPDLAREEIKNLSATLDALGRLPKIEHALTNLIRTAISSPTLTEAVLQEATRTFSEVIGIR